MVLQDARQRPRLSHNGKTDLVSGEKPSGLLPAHCAKLDVMLLVCQVSGAIMEMGVLYRLTFSNQGSQGINGT